MSSSLHTDLDQAFGYPADEVDYLCNIGRRHSFLYVEVPKVACSSIKRTLQLIEASADRPAPANIHDKKNSPLSGPLSSGLSFDQLFNGSRLFRFAFVRNPFSRILSCYLEKIVKHEWERANHHRLLGFSQAEPSTLTEFLQAVERIRDRNRDIHWKSQSGLIGGPAIHYDFIGRFENLDADFRHVLTQIGIPQQDLFLESITHHATNASSKLNEYFGPAEIAMVQRTYAADFLRFGYSSELPKS